MRNPIRTREGAEDIQYSLKPTCASIALIIALILPGWALTGCSESGTTNESAANSPTRSTPLSEQADKTGASVEQPVIVFLGTSLTAGYGLEESQAFPALIQDRIDHGDYDYSVVNAGVSGDTSAGGLRRLEWLLRLPISVLVLELGANDMLRGQNVDQLRTNLEAILDQTRASHPKAQFVIAGMRAAPNLGRDYAQDFDGVFAEVAERYDAAFIPFLLEDVAARRNLNQADGIHPTAEGHVLIADRVWKTLETVLH